MNEYMLKTGEGIRKLKDDSWKQDLKLGLGMFTKGRLPLFPKGIKNKKEVKKILENID